ncbi:MAG: FAD-linked oxidase C-terminal domain-containing protein, partial [Myxococcota bacterium]
WKVAASEADRKALWQLRAKGVGLLGNTKGRRKPVPFVEDTVVPPERLAEYVAEFRAILDAEGLTYGMFGHVDVGCLHVRPALDLRDPEDEKRVRRISDKVAALCDKFGGVIWGEHGKGFRSEYSPMYFGGLYPIVRQVKRIFDPDDRLNPGKIAVAGDAAAGGKPSALASIDQPLRGHSDRHVARASQDDFAIAIDCNGNGQCYSWDPGHVMCPSSKVTRDRVHTPKGRAGVMREWLRQLSNNGVTVTKARRPSRLGQVFGWPVRAWNTAFKRYDYSRDVHRAMDGCLACKACATQCPVKVDVPSFRAHFLEQYHTRYLRKPSDALVGRLEGALRLMARLPLVFNFFLGMRWFQKLMGAVTGLVDTPLLARPTLRQRLKARGLAELDWRRLELGGAPPDKTVYLLQDAFTTFYEPDIVLAARDVLEVLGWKPVLVPFFENGKGLHVKGFLGRFDKTVRKNVALLERLARTGAPIVGIEPAVVLTYRDEYVATQRAAGRPAPSAKVELLQEFLAARLPKSVPASPSPAVGVRPRYRLFG